MKIRHPWLIKILGFALACVVRLWLATLRFQYHAIGKSGLPRHAHLHGCYIYVFWHENMLLPAYHCRWPNIRVLVSQHADGQLVAEVCRHMGIFLVRGSTSRGGIEALRQLVRLSQYNHLVVTPDGPRGPRRCVQEGVIYLAAKTGLPIIAMGIGYQHPWRLRSWDRFVVPKPWRRATMVTAAPLSIPRHLEPGSREHYCRLVEETLRDVSLAAEHWAERGGSWANFQSETMQTERPPSPYHESSANNPSSARS